jgi:RimJ/RimL family protein N-acetyltransferase
VTAPLLTGRIVLLRGLELDDVDDWLAGEDEDQLRWFEVPRRSQRDDVVRAISAWRESWKVGGPVWQWGICDRPSGTIAGGVELRRIDDSTANLSYVVFSPWRRRGFALEAASHAVAYAADHLGVRNVVMKILEGNVASLALASRLGATEVGSAPSDAGGRFIVHHLAPDPSIRASALRGSGSCSP